jgi:hypothetical protein
VDLSVARQAGGYLITAPSLPGWSQHARNPGDLARVLERVFTEAEIAAYSKFHGVEYDAAEHARDSFEPAPPAQPAPTPIRRHPAEPSPSELPRASYRPGAAHRPDCHDPADWSLLPDGSGRWRSPDGRAWKPTAAVVASVVARRAALGLPTSA